MITKANAARRCIGRLSRRHFGQAPTPRAASRRAGLRRPVHLGRLQPQPARHPADPAQDGGGREARRLRPGQPRRQGAAAHSRDLPPRRAVPDRRRRFARHRARDSAIAGTPAGRPVPAPRQLRALRRGDDLRPARTLHHRSAPQDAGDPGTHHRRHPGGAPNPVRRFAAGPPDAGGENEPGKNPAAERGRAGRRIGRGRALLDRKLPRRARIAGRPCSPATPRRSRRAIASTFSPRPRPPTSRSSTAPCNRAPSPSTCTARRTRPRTGFASSCSTPAPRCRSRTCCRCWNGWGCGSSTRFPTPSCRAGSRRAA